MLLRASRGRNDRLQALTIAGRNGEGDGIAHASNSHATPQNGIPKSDSFDPINPLDVAKENAANLRARVT